MLDNFEPEQLKKDAASLKENYPHVIVEASGGITTETMDVILVTETLVMDTGRKMLHGAGRCCLAHHATLRHGTALRCAVQGSTDRMKSGRI